MVVAVVGALLFGGCTDGPEQQPLHMGGVATATETPQDPMAGAPALGSCFELSAAQARALTNGSTPVDCAEPHTALTFHVGLFEKDALTSDPAVAKRGCQRNVRSSLDLTPRQLRSSVLQWVWFEPSTTQWSAGARWYRCDLIALNMQETRLKSLPSGGSPFSDGIPDNLARCLQSRNEKDRHLTCDQPHNYRWSGSFRAKAKKAPASDSAALRLAQGPCTRLTGTRNWYVVWPSATDWAAGDHQMDCYKETSR